MPPRRSERIRKKPTRLTNQAKSVKSQPPKKKKDVKNGGVQKKPTRATDVKKLKRNEPKSIKKADIIKIIRSKNTNGQNKNLIKLASLYHLMEETQIKRDFNSGGNILEMIDKQNEAIKKSTLKINPKSDFIFENDEIRLGFLVLMWLDMSHDMTVIKGWKITDKSKTPIYYTFKEFLGLKISKILIPKTPQLKITDFISRLKEIGAIKDITNNNNIDIEIKPGFEKTIKLNLGNLFELKDEMSVTSGISVGKYLKNGINNPIYISIDQESDKLTPISDLIIKSKYDIENNNGVRLSSYSIKSLITLANIIDPGAFGNKTGLIRDVGHLFDKKNTRTFSKFVDVEEFNLDGTKIKIIPSSSDYGKYDIKINDDLIIKGGETKKIAGKSNNNNKKISKFFGDFIQILSVISTQKTINSTSGTGDAIMAAMSLFIQKYVMKSQNPKLILDTSFKSGNKNVIIYGFSSQFKNDYVKNKSLSPTNKTGVRRPARGRTNNTGVNQPAKRPNAQQNAQRVKRPRPPSAQQNAQRVKRPRPPRAQEQTSSSRLTPVKRARPPTPPIIRIRSGAPTRGNSAGNFNYGQQVGNIQIKSSNSVTQGSQNNRRNTTNNGRRPGASGSASNSARSNQTRG